MAATDTITPNIIIESLQQVHSCVWACSIMCYDKCNKLRIITICKGRGWCEGGVEWGDGGGCVEGGGLAAEEGWRIIIDGGKILIIAAATTATITIEIVII